mgnify:CR=1 FL=1
MVNFFNGLAPVAALVIGGYLVITGQTSIGVVVAFISGFDRLADFEMREAGRLGFFGDRRGSDKASSD